MLERAMGRCEACGRPLGRGYEVHHIEERSGFGTKRDAEKHAPRNLIVLCQGCHRAAHGAYATGRLVIRASLGEPVTFVCEVVYARDKFAAREGNAT